MSNKYAFDPLQTSTKTQTSSGRIHESTKCSIRFFVRCATVLRSPHVYRTAARSSFHLFAMPTENIDLSPEKEKQIGNGSD